MTIPKAETPREIAPVDPTCTSSSPCIEYDNNGTGPGIRGISVSGNGIAGETGFKSTSAANARAGIAGVDVSVSGSFNSGVKGTSTRGFGVSGVSNSSSFPGAGVSGLLGPPSGLLVFASGAVYGDSRDGSGVLATSANASAVVAASSNSFGVDGITLNKSLTTGHSLSGVLGNDASSDGGHLNIGVSGESTNGIGVQGISSKWVGVNAVGGAFQSGGLKLPALSVVGNGTGAPLIEACASQNPCEFPDDVFSVDTVGQIFARSIDVEAPSSTVAVAAVGSGADIFVGSSGLSQRFAVSDAGNLTIAGQIFTAGSCSHGCAPGASKQERRVVSYTPRESVPTMEDFGEGQLVGGSAYIRLDPAFSNVIDSRANYLVFITPEGDNRGLYVTQKSVSGFAVRESQGGRSTIPFSFRIVAKPFGSREDRLPMVELPRLHRGRLTRARPLHL